MSNRYQEYVSGLGLKFTCLHAPMSILQQRQVSDIFAEDNEVEKLMFIFGIDQVRGGTHSQLELSSERKEHLRRKF